MAGQIDARSATSVDSPHTLIIGRHGRLARAFRHFFPLATAIGRAEVDISDDASVKRAVAMARPSLVINCAAITDLTRCEQDPVGTRRVNVEGVANLAAASNAAGAILVHFSTDYAADPVNEYGRGKRESEKYADLTLRAKIYDGSHWAWEALRGGRSIRMTTCEFSNPISTTGVAALLPFLLKMGLRGVVSLGSKDRLSFFEVGQVWADVLGASREMVEPTGPIASPYPRPADTFMPVQALMDVGLQVPSLEADASSHLAHLI